MLLKTFMILLQWDLCRLFPLDVIASSLSATETITLAPAAATLQVSFPGVSIVNSGAVAVLEDSYS